MPGKLQVVVGGQYGSEAKGAVAAHLARDERELLAIRVAGPNAGHTVVDDEGRTWRLRQVPVAAVTNRYATLAIAAGSEIDEPVLDYETALLDAAGYRVSQRLYIDQSATRIEDTHKYAELLGSLTDRIGSTGKGVGAARADRVMRTAELWGGVHDIADMATYRLSRGHTVLVEGTQGYGLGLHGEHYPHCTSSDCRAVDFLAMAGISPWYAEQLEVWVVLRTYPIRVAGNSGPMAGELTWDQLHEASGGYIQPETTTVTGKTRRVAGWDPVLARAALKANGYPCPQLRVALTFLDYVLPEIAGESGAKLLGNWDVRERLENLEYEIGQPISLVGTGPAAYTNWDV